MSISISAMREESFTIFVQKAGSRMVTPRPLRYMDVRIAAAVSISQSAYINTMHKKMTAVTRS